MTIEENFSMNDDFDKLDELDDNKIKEALANEDKATQLKAYLLSKVQKYSNMIKKIEGSEISKSKHSTNHYSQNSDVERFVQNIKILREKLGSEEEGGDNMMPASTAQFSISAMGDESNNVSSYEASSTSIRKFHRRVDSDNSNGWKTRLINKKSINFVKQ